MMKAEKGMGKKPMWQSPKQPTRQRLSPEAGFTLVETVIALVIMMIVGLGAASLFVYSLTNNSGANDRELAKAVAQQRLERLRNVDFDDASLAATAGTTETVTSGDRNYTVLTTIVNNTPVAPNTLVTLKTITIQVTPQTAGPIWTRGSVMVMTQRSDTQTGSFIVSAPAKKKKK